MRHRSDVRHGHDSHNDAQPVPVYGQRAKPPFCKQPENVDAS